MKGTLNVLGILLVFILIAGSGVTIIGVVSTRVLHSGQAFQNERIDNVERVLMHEPGYYSLLVNQGGRLVTRSFGQYGRLPVELITDVAQTEKMWAEVKVTLLARDCFLSLIWKCQETWDYRVYVHVTSAKMVEGASWDHGKFGRGMTIVVN